MWNSCSSSKTIEKWFFDPSENILLIVYKSNPNLTYCFSISSKEMEGLTPVDSFFYNLTKTKSFIKLES